MEIYIGLAVVALILIWAVMTYNRFISLRRFKDEAWSDIAVQLKRRHDLVPNLLSLVKRYAQHEKDSWKRSPANVATLLVIPAKLPKMSENILAFLAAYLR